MNLRMENIVYKQHVGVYGVIGEEGKILLVTKSRGPYIGKLDLPGGRLEHGETPLEALTRELREETGLTLAHAVLRDVYTIVVTYEASGQHISLYQVGIVYVVTLAGDQRIPQVIERAEDVSRAAWYERAHIDESQMTPFVQRLKNI